MAAGHIRKRGEKWQVIVTVRDAVTGKPKQLSATRGTKKEAEIAKAELLVQANKGEFASGEGSVGDLLRHAFKVQSANLAPGTVCTDRSVLAKHLLPYFDGVGVTKCTTADITRYLHMKLDEGQKPSTLQRHHSILTRTFTWAKNNNLVSQNPASDADAPRCAQSEMVVPSPEQVQKVIGFAGEQGQPEFALFLRLAATTGCRRGELCALQRKDVDLEKGELLIAHSMSRTPEGGQIRKSTKTNKPRRIALGAETRERLAAHMEYSAARARAMGVVLPASAYVFSVSADCSKPRDPVFLSRRFRQYADACGLDGVRLHDLRHYAATQMIAQGMDIRTVAGRLGHTNVATTLNVYAAFLPSRDRDAAEGLDETLGGL